MFRQVFTVWFTDLNQHMNANTKKCQIIFEKDVFQTDV